jgi:DNA-binding GntR family transcriptional regulator
MKRENVYNMLFDRIYEGKYPMGFRLKEIDLSNEFSISRGHVREVLKQLHHIGLVEIMPNRGAVVVGLTQDDIEEIYEIRKYLEIIALKAALSRIRMKELSTFRLKLMTIGPNTPIDIVAEMDHELHTFIVEASERRYLKRILEVIYQLISRIRMIAFRDPVEVKLATAEHLALIEAIFRRDEEKATKILSDHLERSKNVVLTTLFQGFTLKKEEEKC